MKESKPEKNLFISLLGKAAKSVVACLFALFLLGLLDNVSESIKESKKKKLFS